MADEQPVPIYLSPDEDLTSVRERLERTQARRIILVIPPQTQLRSHVGWRLIHARMREMGKDLLVISPDRQVRAVARAAGFRVAETQESTSSRPRPGSSSTRPGSINTRGAARSRISSSRGTPDSRGSQQPGGSRRLTPNASKRPITPLPPERDHYNDDEITLEHPGGQPAPGVEESQHSAPPATLFKDPTAQKRSFNDFHISTTPSVRPSVPGHIDDDIEDDAYYDDYNTAQRIRKEASASGSERSSQDDFSSVLSGESQEASAKHWKNDPFVYMEDEQQHLPLPEQRGSMPGLFDEVGTSVPDISDRSTEIMENEIEDLGDLGAITPPEITSLPKQPAPPREQTGRSRRPAGPTRQHSPRSPRPVPPSFDDDEDDLLAIPDRPTQAGRSSRELVGSQRPSQALGSPQRPSQALKPAPPSQRPSQALSPASSTQRPSQALKPAPPSQRPSQALRLAQPQRPSQALRPGAAPQLAPRGRTSATIGARTPILAPQAQARNRQRPARRGNRVLGVVFTLVVLLLIVTGFLLYFVPTATVTISVQTQSYSKDVRLIASANPKADTPGSFQAQVLEYSAPISGQSTASGQTRVGNTRAQGSVAFTNNGKTDVVIPTGTIITSTGGIPFTTSAEAFVSHSGGNYPAVPISAQQAGVSGNVGANTITTIPADSLSKIAAYNHTTVQALSLTVTNPQATSQGGARSVPAVTQQDIQTLEHMLHQKLQQQFTAWLNTQTQQGDFHGTPMPNVLTSANPLPAEQFSDLPAAGQAEESGSFTGTLTAHIKILVARSSAISAAAREILKTAAQQNRPQPMVLVSQLPVTLTNAKSVAAQDGTGLTITGKAFGAITRQINTQDISGTLAGKGIDQARSDLRASMAQLGIQDTTIAVTPSFLGFMPLRADRIRIILQPIQPVQNTVPNG